MSVVNVVRRNAFRANLLHNVHNVFCLNVVVGLLFTRVVSDGLTVGLQYVLPLFFVSQAKYAKNDTELGFLDTILIVVTLSYVIDKVSIIHYVVTVYTDPSHTSSPRRVK